MKLLKKISLQKQIIIVNTFLLITSLLLYLAFLNIIENTTFYLNYPQLTNILFWIIIITIIVVLEALLIEKITFPVKEFIGYAKEFEEINFKEIANEMTNADFIKLANAFNDLQQQLFKTIEETKRKNNEILLLNNKMKQDLAYKRNLVSSISHDIKTPLTIIEATIHGIKDDIFSKDEIPNELDNVVREIQKTKKMLQDTINIYKIESDIANSNDFEEFQLIDIITNLTDDFKTLFEKYHQTLSLNLQSDHKIKGDKKQFKKAISNIILNAIVHSPQNSKIFINIISNNKHKVLEFINTGINISEDELSNIFKPFYQTDKSRTNNEDFGNGLGLYIAQEILKMHNLKLNVVNLENAVKFYIEFN
jgi:signal transduction histidine kinase